MESQIPWSPDGRTPFFKGGEFLFNKFVVELNLIKSVTKTDISKGNNMLLATQPQPFFSVVKDSFRFYRWIFPKTILFTFLLELIIIGVFFTQFQLGLLTFPQQNFSSIFFSLVCSALASYPYTALLIKGYGILANNPTMVENTGQLTYQRFHWVAAYMVCLSLLQYFVIWATSFPFIQLLGSLIISYISIVFAFGPALIAIRQEKVLTAFKKSASLTWVKWWRTFGVFFIISLPILIGLFIVVLMAMQSVSENFAVLTIPLLISAIVLVLLLPFFIIPLCVSGILTVFNDLELRAASKLK
jgi:hypothetical protein